MFDRGGVLDKEDEEFNKSGKGRLSALLAMQQVREEEEMG